MRHTNHPLFWVIAAAAALMTLPGCDKPAARAEPPPPKVTVTHPEARQIVAADDYNGWMDALATVEVRSRVRGYIEKINFTDGQIVQKGQILFELDPRPFQAEIGAAEDQG